MTIIKPGNLDSTVLCGTCERCGCEVEVAEEECKQGSHFDPKNQEVWLFVHCPTQFCGEQIRIYAR